MANRERSSESPDEIAASIKAKNADKKNSNKKQNSGNQNKKGGNNSENSYPHWRVVKEEQKAQKNKAKVKKHESNIEVRNAEIKDLEHEIEAIPKIADLKEKRAKLLEEYAGVLRQAAQEEENGTAEKLPDPETVVKVTVDIVEEAAKDQEVAVKVAVSSGQITEAQGEQIRSVLFAEDGRKGFFSRMKVIVGDWSAKHPRLSAFAVGMGAGVAVRTAVKAGYVAAFGANLPFAVAAGATAGGLLEGGKALWRESKAYQPKEILTKFRQADYLEKAAMLNKLEELYKNQKFAASPEEYQEIERTLGAARFELQAELDKKDGKFANYSEKDKISYLLNSSRGVKDGFDKTSRGKEVQVLLRRVERNLDYKRNYGDVFKNKKAVVARAILKGSAYGALGATVGAALVEGIDRAWSGSAAVVQEVTTTTETRGNLSESYTNKLDHRGLTGGARDSIHSFIEEHKGVDANFANGVTVEQLVYAEDTIVKEALKQGIDVNSSEFTISSAYVEDALIKAGVVGDGPKLTEAGMRNISELIQTKAHFLSEATKAKMLDFDPAAMEQFITESVQEYAVNNSTELSADDYAALAVVAAGIIAAEALDRRSQNNADARMAGIVGYQGAGSTGSTVSPNERFPKGPPSGPNNPDSKNRPDADRPIPKPTEPIGPDTSPQDFDWGAALGQKTEEGDSEESKEEKAEKSSVESEFNNQLAAAGINAEIYLSEAIQNKKQLARIEQILEDFIKSAKQLKTLNLGTKVILDVYAKGDRTLVSKENIVIIGIPLSSKIDAKDMGSVVDRVIENETSKRFSEFESGYKINVKIPDQKVFNRLSAADQYRAVNRLNQAFDEIDAKELKRITVGLKAVNITDYQYIDRDEVSLQLFRISDKGFEYNALKSAEIIQMLKESYQDRRALGPMNREEQFAKYPSLKTNQAWANIPESKRVPAEEILLDIINRKFPDGLPSDVKVTMGNKFQMKPGVLMLDLSKPDEEYIVRQLNVGLRRADPDRLNRVPRLVRERFARKSRLGVKKEEWPKVKEVLTLRPITEKGRNSGMSSMEIQEETIENNGLDQRWVDDARARIKNSIPKRQIELIKAYMAENKITIEDLLSQKEKLPKISNVMATKFKNYIRHQTIDQIESLIRGSDSDKQKAHQLRDKYLEFIKK
ncbi:MAG TPA: hypothetical protein PKD34_00960 [Candidatus Doudnabacteria bacterium]|nr:hypothetical protein [Candidatus Doudnabacteria bacterium]